MMAEQFIFLLLFLLFVFVCIHCFRKFIASNALFKAKKNIRAFVSISGAVYVEYTDNRFFLTKNFKRIEELGHSLACENCAVLREQIKDSEAETVWGILTYKKTVERRRERHSRHHSLFNRRFTASDPGMQPYVDDLTHEKVTLTNFTYFYYISHKDLRLPYFFMRDENAVLDGIGKVFGGQDINFEPADEFSSSFVLQSEVESEIRKAFTPNVRRLFANLAGKKYIFEGEYDSIVIRGEITTQSEFDFLNRTMIAIIKALLKNNEKKPTEKSQFNN